MSANFTTMLKPFSSAIHSTSSANSKEEADKIEMTGKEFISVMRICYHGDKSDQRLVRILETAPNAHALANFIDAEGNTPLHHYVSSNADINRVKRKIIELSDNPFIRNKQGLSPLHSALVYCDYVPPELCKALVSRMKVISRESDPTYYPSILDYLSSIEILRIKGIAQIAHDYLVESVASHLNAINVLSSHPIPSVMQLASLQRGLSKYHTDGLKVLCGAGGDLKTLCVPADHNNSSILDVAVSRNARSEQLFHSIKLTEVQSERAKKMLEKVQESVNKLVETFKAHDLEPISVPVMYDGDQHIVLGQDLGSWPYRLSIILKPEDYLRLNENRRDFKFTSSGSSADEGDYISFGTIETGTVKVGTKMRTSPHIRIDDPTTLYVGYMDKVDDKVLAVLQEPKNKEKDGAANASS